jgi:acetyl esterase/lipase
VISLQKTALAIFMTVCAAGVDAQVTVGVIEADGTVVVPSYRLPPSPYMSPEARKALPRAVSEDGDNSWAEKMTNGTASVQRHTTTQNPTWIQHIRDLYPVNTEEVTIAGIHAYRVIPLGGVPEHNRGKILINLSGGGFVSASAADGGLNESIPVAALARMEVVTLDYRQAPEAKFPAASEDVAAVFRSLLKTHQAKNIGIFGCSAGGLLTAQSLAWIDKEHLPMPAAAGIFCASADARWGGDSWSWQKPMLGLATPPSLDERFYYGDHDLADPLMSPMESLAILSRFPPTLFITGSRAPELSSAINTHRLLTKVGVDADLHVWDGMGHAFFGNVDLPESKEAFDVMARFFQAHLGHDPAHPGTSTRRDRKRPSAG